MKANRIQFGDTLFELAKKDPDIVVCGSDFTMSVNYGPFKESFPDRFFECGIAEQNMFAVAAGLASTGLLPIAGSYAVFTSSRGLDQVRNGICYNNLNVKIIGSHGGLETGPDGGTHQSVEDMAIMRSIPRMRVFAPSTVNMTKKLTYEIIYSEGPAYLRFGREPSEELYDENELFPLGGSKVLHEGSDAAILAYGNMVQVSVEAARQLEKDDIHVRVLDMYSIKPIDREAVLAAARETKGIVTVEDHSIVGGLGGAVAEITAEQFPVKVIRIGIQDRFGRSGKAAELMKLYGLTADHIVETVKNVLQK